MPIVVTDVAALGSLMLASQVGGDAADWVALAGVGAYALGGPIVHFTEGRTAAGFGSFALRVGAPLVGGAAGIGVGLAAAGDCYDDWCGLEAAAWGALIGFGGGLVTALVVDYAELAYKPAKTAPLALSVTPTYKPTTGAAGVAVSGRW